MTKAMKITWTLCLVSLPFCLLASAVVSTSKQEFEDGQKLIYERELHLYRTNPQYARLYDAWAKESTKRILNESFPCEILPPSSKVPTSVHKLRPGDIKVIGAVGDSLTAGRAILHGILGILTDYPQLSWSIGGEGTFEDHLTLPNILRKYNPNIRGSSPDKKTRNLNKAVSGAKSDEMLDQVQTLVQDMQDDKDIDFEKDWKIVTLFIGGNDICDICNNYTLYSAENYASNVRIALDYLQDHMPRTFVNLAEMINVDIVQELNSNLLCSAAHQIACDCAAFPKDEEARQLLLKYREEYQIKLRELASSGRYDVKRDFTVVLQPFYRETYPPYKPDGTVDLSYFASDCFHQSEKGQEAAAKALWNNMVEPVGSKRLDWHPNEGLECPTENQPYLFTNKNSA